MVRIIFFFLVCLMSYGLSADVVKLRNGKTLIGSVIEKKGTLLLVRTKNRVERVLYSDVLEIAPGESSDSYTNILPKYIYPIVSRRDFAFSWNILGSIADEFNGFELSGQLRLNQQFSLVADWITYSGDWYNTAYKLIGLGIRYYFSDLFNSFHVSATGVVFYEGPSGGGAFFDIGRSFLLFKHLYFDLSIGAHLVSGDYENRIRLKGQIGFTL